MNIGQVPPQRLYNQLLYKQPFSGISEVVHWMGAIQAQDYLASLWAIGLRISPTVQVSEDSIEQAIITGQIVRTWPMRGTLHFVAAEDVHWMLRLLTPGVLKSSARRYRKLELDETVFSKSRGIFYQILQGERQLTRAELFSHLGKSGISTAGQRGIHILSHLAQTGMICFGPRRGKQPTFTLLDEWIPAGKELPEEEALETLAMRYISSRGPVTDYDFAAWSGLTLMQVRKAMHIVRNDFEQIKVGGQTYWFPDPGTLPNTGSQETYLLPAFDEMLCGYKDRSAILPPEHVKSIILKNGLFRPTIVANGKIIGSWKRTLRKERVLIELNHFGQNSLEHKNACSQAGERYGAFLRRIPEIRNNF